MSQVDFNEAPTKKSNVALLVILGGCGCVVLLFLMGAVLSFILLPVILQTMGGSHEAAPRMRCANNMKYIALALHNYHDANKCLPPAYTVDEDGNPLHSWRVLFLPYVEQTALYNAIRLDEPWDSEYNSQFHSQMPSCYCCPSTDAMAGMTTYSVIVGEETPFGDPTVNLTLGSISDGLSNTIFIVERKTPVCWMDPTQEITFEEACKGINVFGNEMGSNHTGGMNVGMFDGSVQFISETIHPGNLRAFFTRAGGESVVP